MRTLKRIPSICDTRYISYYAFPCASMIVTIDGKKYRETRWFERVYIAQYLSRHSGWKSVAFVTKEEYENYIENSNL